MGLLDEAIREHLDLKRRRGADPSELDRQEREALGPVRRGPHESPDLADDEPPTGDYPAEEETQRWDEELEEPVAFDHTAASTLDAPTEFWSDPSLDEDADDGALHGYEPEEPPLRDYEPEPRAAPERRSDAPRHHEIAEEWEAHERQGYATEPADLEPDAPSPVPPRPAAPPPASDPVAPPPPDFDQETEEYHVEAEEPHEPGPGEAAEGEDVLEETPDFLQDTPDHDRLWFEQRPPKDFDFGK